MPVQDTTNFLGRMWRKAFGHLIYGGEETCGHCVYWKPPRVRSGWVPCTSETCTAIRGYRNCRAARHFVHIQGDKGDCKLIFGKEDTSKDDTCKRFKAKRRYKHREA